MRIRCDFFRAYVMAQFDALSQYRHHAERWIQESHHSRRSEILIQNQPPANLTPVDLQQWHCERQSEMDELDRLYRIDFQRNLRFASIIMLDSLVESNLFRIMRELTERKKLNREMDDLMAKNLVKRFKKFWTEVTELEWWEDKRWSTLQDIEELRNCIAHRNGVIREKDGRIKQLIDKKDGVRRFNIENNPLADTDERDTLEIDARYCDQALMEMRELFDEIFSRGGFGPETPIIEPS